MRLIALIAAAIVAAAAGDIDPCKRQPFRGRCPSKNGAPPSRSQFVLRYYLRDGECVSYPYGHCLNDDSEPKLFRYKEECEDACVKGPGNLGTPKETVKVVKTVDTSSSTDDANVDFEMTYGTVPPITENTAAPTTAPHAEPTVTPKTEKPTPETEKPTPKTVAPNTEEATEESSASTTEKATTVEASTTSAPRTECERRRAQSGGLIRGGFVPACTPEGQFEKMQCEPSGGQCFCVDDKGIELPNSRTRGLPDCTRILSASAPKSNECVGVPTSGPCSSSMERWYYDESMQLCKAFKYSGCGGNGNNYASEQACKARCAPPPLGAPKCEKGEPLKTVTGAPINCAKRDCPTGYKCSVIQGSSVCCPQNEKSAGALQSGHPSDPCQMQKERGPCDRYELRFYYNAEMKECKYFFYGGCDGNGNNFEKVEDCEVRCNVTKPTRFGGHVTQSLNPTQPAGAQTVTKESTTERPTTQRPTTHSTTSTTVRPTTGPVLSLRPAVAQGPDQTVMESNRCRHPKDAGTCRGQFVRWFFNFELGRCEAFTYTGCAGNGNNFASEEECLTGCAKEGTKNGQVTTAILETDDGEKEVPAVANVCIHDVDAGDCNGVFQRFAFDQESGECRPFTYGGCGGNGNNFAALADCERKCGGAKAPVVVAPTTAPFVPPPVNICEHPVDKGPCNGIFARYAFDPLTSDCQQFTYGGCGGNGNNFASASDCRQVCMKPSTKASHTTATPVVHCPPAPRCQPGCQMARDQHSCIVCNCDRAAHPPAPLPSAPQARPACPLIDMQACVEPCIVFSNRKGCQECVCPVPDPNFQQTVQPHGASIFSSAATVAAAQPPSHRESVAPPSFNTAHPPGFVHPPAPRQQSVKNVESFQKQELQEIEKPLAPLPTNRVEPLRTLPTQDSRSPGQAPPQHLAPHFPREQFSPQVPQTHSGPIAPAPVPAQLTEKCMQPVDAGPCSNYVDRWFFNADDGQCHPFKYGGCAGNRNHFFTMRECEIHCARFSRFVTSVPKAAGVAQFGVTPDVDNAQYVPPQLVDRRAFGEHNREMEPIALSTLDKLGDTTSSLEMNEPHPPTSSFEENSIEEDDVPRAPGTSSSVPPSTTPSVPSVSVSVPRDTSPPAAIPPVTFAAVERVVETTSPSTEAPTTTTAASTTSTITTTEKATAPAATTTQANTVTAKVTEETSEEEDVEYEVSETDTPVFASLPPKLKEQPASVFVPKTSTLLPTAAPTTTDTVAPAMKEVKIVPKIHLEGVTAPLTEKTVSAEKTSKEEVEDDWEEETDSPFTDDESSLAEAHRVEGVKNVQTASKIPEKPDTSTDDISAEVADPDMRPMPSSTDAPSTTSTAPPTTEKSKTANTAPTRQQLPVRPDGAGREPVPLAPVGIGRSMQELNIDQMDGELEQPTEKIFHPTVAPTRAPETPRAEQHNNEHFNTHSLRQDSFSPQVSCTLPPDAGLCKNYVPRWFFNAQTGLCEQFSFGSCGGNANNFMDRANCEFKCRSLHRPTSVLSQVPERCSFEKDTGFGRGYNVKWYFNMKNLRCEQFVYEGKGGNANQFDTLTDCERYCTPQPGSVVVRPAVQLPPLQTPIPQPPAPRQQPPPQPVPVPQPATVNTESRLPQAQAPVISAPGHSSSSAMDSDEALQPEEMEESKEAGGVNTNNNLQEIPDSVHSFENPQAELDKLDAEYDDGPAAPVVASRPPVGSEEVSAIPAFEPRPPAAAHSAKTKNVQAPQPIPNVAADIDDKPKESYKAEPIPAKPAATGNEGLPRVGLTPPETVNYQTGAKPKTHGILNFGEGNAIDTDKFEFPEDSDEPKPPMPTCPNGLQEHRYVDGRAVQCLPGRNQCPDNSECYFNGLDYYCCPNVEDPYDKHVFGGYDGEEEKHGYKAFGPLKIRRLRDQPMSRRKRQSAFNMDDIVLPLRFDDSKPKQFARAGAIMPTRNVRRKQASINKQKEALDVASANVAVCVQELAKGDCSEAHLRYFYDRNSDSCRLFYYSGCKGNENNFGSLEDCQKTCVLGMKQMQVVANANIPTQSATEPPVLPGQCPGGKSPLGGAAPVLCGNNTDSIGCPIGYHCRNGPPDVCCPGQDPAKLSLDLLLAQKSNVRFAPRIDADQFSVTTTEAPHRSFLDVPKFICPDASDPLMGTNGLPLMCGAGFDGMKMCPRGFYCAIDSEKGSRLCCPLLGAGSRLPSQEAQTPYFGRRKANPGEVIDRGTLPADQVEYTRRKEKLAVEQAKPQLPETGPSPSEFEDTENSESAQTSVEAQTAGAQESTEAQSGESSTETASNEEGFAQLKMKPDNNHEKEQKEAAAHNPHVAVVDAESDGVSINTGAEAKSELEDDNVQSKEIVDQSICHLTPSEGRQCRDDEQSPRTNLHYFYSAKDKRCKLYFYRGCGGNANRFEKKAACEERCLTRA